MRATRKGAVRCTLPVLVAAAVMAAPLLVAPSRSAAAGARETAARDDSWLAGYAAAVVERDFGLEVVSSRVSRGTVTVTVRQLSGIAPERIAEALGWLEGIERVEVRVAGDGPEPRAEATADAEVEEGIDFLPRQEIFDPLLADPLQPHFSAGYLWYLDDDELTHVGRVNAGETFALFGGKLGRDDSRWELGLLGAVNSIFDLDAASYDLANSDFWIGPTFSVRADGLSAQLRVYHQSSHLGDEFVLRNRARRVNLSYEAATLLVSADLHSALRLYAGAGAIFHDEPNLQPLSAQGGVEVQSPITFFGGLVRPLAAADFQFKEEHDWAEQIGVVAGVQLENPEVSRLRLQVLGEYYHGNSPNGQFFERRIEYAGIGLHLHF